MPVRTIRCRKFNLQLNTTCLELKCDIKGGAMKLFLTLTALALLIAIPYVEADALPVDADAYIKGGNLNDNFGSDDKVIISHDSDDLGNAYKQYLRFGLSTLTGPVVDVALTLTAESDAENTEPFFIYGLNDGAGDAWSENSITWNNAPGNDSSSSTEMIDGDTTLLGTFSVSGSVEQGDAVTFADSMFDTFINADTNDFVTFILTPGRSSSPGDPFKEFKFAARGHGSFQAPTLSWNEASSVSVPDASVMLLVGTCLVCLLGLDRKRLFKK